MASYIEDESYDVMMKCHKSYEKPLVRKMLSTGEMYVRTWVDHYDDELDVFSISVPIIYNAATAVSFLKGRHYWGSVEYVERKNDKSTFFNDMCRKSQHAYEYNITY